MNNKQPLVSIGIPTYNRVVGLENALQCISKQTYLNLEIIVSDNCTQGGEIDKLMNRFIEEDPRISFYKQSKNIGAISNFEFVLSKATGKYFLWAADDDLCEKDFIEKIIKHMESHKELVLCGCDIKTIDENDKFIKNDFLNSIREPRDWNETRKLFFRYPTSNIFFCIYGIYKREVLQKCNLNISIGWKGLLTNGEVPFLAQVALKGEITAIPEVLKIYRSHSDSTYHKEVKTLSKIDFMMMKTLVRFKLCKLAVINDEPLLIRISLLNAIFTSYMGSINIKSKVLFFVPKRIKLYIKKIM